MKKIKTEIKHKIFEPGELLVSSMLLAVSSEKMIQPLLERHLLGDWGDVDIDARMINMFGFHEPGEEIKGRYKIPQGETVVIITAADRSRTLVMLERELFYRPILEREHHEELL